METPGVSVVSTSHRPPPQAAKALTGPKYRAWPEICRIYLSGTSLAMEVSGMLPDFIRNGNLNSIYIYIWRFPEMGVPLDHPF